MDRFEKINDQHQIAQLKTVSFIHSLPAVDIIASTAIGFVLWTGGVSALAVHHRRDSHCIRAILPTIL